MKPTTQPSPVIARPGHTSLEPYYTVKLRFPTEAACSDFLQKLDQDESLQHYVGGAFPHDESCHLTFSRNVKSEFKQGHFSKGKNAATLAPEISQILELAASYSPLGLQDQGDVLNELTNPAKCAASIWCAEQPVTSPASFSSHTVSPRKKPGVQKLRQRIKGLSAPVNDSVRLHFK